MSPNIFAVKPRITLNSSPSRLYSANSDTSSSVQTSLNNLSVSLKAPAPASASTLTLGQSGNGLKTYEALEKAIREGKVKHIRCVLDPYNHAPAYKVHYDLVSGEKGEVKLILSDEVKDLRNTCKEYKVEFESDIPGAAEIARDVGKDVFIQLVTPAAMIASTWFGLKYGAVLKHSGNLKASIIDVNAHTFLPENERFSLRNVRDHIVGVPQVHDFADSVRGYLDSFEKTGERSPFGALVCGLERCGKTVTIKNAIKEILEVDKACVAFDVDESMEKQGFMSITLGARDKAKAYIKAAQKKNKDVKAITLFIDDPETRENPAHLMKLVKEIQEEAKKSNLVVYTFVATNAPEKFFNVEHSGVNANEVGAMINRMGLEIYNIQEIDKKGMVEKFNKDFNSMLGSAPPPGLFNTLYDEVKKELSSSSGLKPEVVLVPTLIGSIVKAMKDKGVGISGLEAEMKNTNSDLRRAIMSKVKTKGTAIAF